MRSVSGQYRTIKAMVFDLVRRTNGRVGFDQVTAEVRTHFPASRWQKTHWAWYRYQIIKGRFVSMFSAEERENLSGGPCEFVPVVAAPPPPGESRSGTHASLARGPSARDPAVKRIGDLILEQTRLAISTAGGGDEDMQFKLNRWVFPRLHQDEIRIKRPIKKSLWGQGMRSCQACGESFASLKAVEIHRKDSAFSYSVGNCELLCRECHQELTRDRALRSTVFNRKSKIKNRKWEGAVRSGGGKGFDGRSSP